MMDFWHNDAVSRLTGNSADVFRESKSPTAGTHPRRQLMVEGGGGETVFSKFLESPEFINFKSIWKSEKGEDIKALPVSLDAVQVPDSAEHRPVRVQDPHSASLVPEGAEGHDAGGPSGMRLPMV